MMEKYIGRGVCGGVAVGRVAVFGREDMSVRRRRTDDTAAELARLEAAKKKALEELGELFERALREVGEANAAIIEIHMMMVEDEDYNAAIREMISAGRVNAEYAVARAGDDFARMFSDMDDAYMRERAADVRDISNRIIRCLVGASKPEKLGSTDEPGSSVEPIIICADDLAPSETVSLDKSRVLAFVTAYGSPNSHTAILARSMNIPAVIGVGAEFLESVRDGELAIADGISGEVILEPSEECIAEAKRRISEESEKRALLERLRGKENITLGGRRINIYANIGSADSIGEVLAVDAGGIGLFRSEFIFLERKKAPTEEEQFAIYKRVLESMAGRKVIIRTLDIGADKRCEYFDMPSEENPALGVRAIRLCLERPEVLRGQLRALFRASVYGKLGIMFPMIANKWELEEVLSLCSEIKAELGRDGIECSDGTELGIMIETPAAAIISDTLAPMVDFFSVGTNDLIQYTLACDRQNPRLERFCDPHHEAVLRLIKTAADNAHACGKWIGICGELAADTDLTGRFIEMGIDELSVAPACVLKLRDRVRSLEI